MRKNIYDFVRYLIGSLWEPAASLLPINCILRSCRFQKEDSRKRFQRFCSLSYRPHMRTVPSELPIRYILRSCRFLEIDSRNRFCDFVRYLIGSLWEPAASLLPINCILRSCRFQKEDSRKRFQRFCSLSYRPHMRTVPSELPIRYIIPAGLGNVSTDIDTFLRYFDFLPLVVSRRLICYYDAGCPCPNMEGTVR